MAVTDLQTKTGARVTAIFTVKNTSASGPNLHHKNTHYHQHSKGDIAFSSVCLCVCLST